MLALDGVPTAKSSFKLLDYIHVAGCKVSQVLVLVPLDLTAQLEAGGVCAQGCNALGGGAVRHKAVDNRAQIFMCVV